MRRPSLLLVALFTLGGVAALWSSCASSGPVYVSLGDSVAAGSGASDPQTTSFAALLARERGLELTNLASAGATTADVIDEQLPVFWELAGDRGLELVTVSAGGNDLAALISNQACVEDPLPDACPVEDALDGVRTRLDEIVRSVRDADDDVPVVLLAYPNFFSGSGHRFDAPAARVLPLVNNVLREVAGGYEGVAVGEPGTAFEGAAGRLTHILDAQPDPHPNDAGHRAIADALAAALDGIE